MLVIPLRAHPLVPIVYRDRSEGVLEVLCEERYTPDMLLDLGYRVCGSCGTWCEPVQVDPSVGCGRCELSALSAELTRGMHFNESPAEPALRIYNRFIVPSPGPARAS